MHEDEDAARFGLPPVAVRALREVFSRHARVESAVVYGSRAKGNFRGGSDIDLSVDGAGLASADLLRLAGEIDDLGLPYQVDLSLYAHVDDAALREHIDRVGQVFYRRADRAAPAVLGGPR